MLDKMHAVTYHKATINHNNNVYMATEKKTQQDGNLMLKRVKIQGYK